jgi:hypothetical protein
MLLQKTEKIDHHDGQFHPLDFKRLPYECIEEVWFGFCNELGSSKASGSGYRNCDIVVDKLFYISLLRDDLDFISIHSGQITLHQTEYKDEVTTQLDFVTIIYHNRLKITIKSFPEQITINQTPIADRSLTRTLNHPNWDDNDKPEPWSDK